MWARFSVHVQTAPRAHQITYAMGTVSFPGVMRPELGNDHPPISSVEIKNVVGLYLYSSSRPSWPFLRWTLPLKMFLCLLSRYFINLGLQKNRFIDIIYFRIFRFLLFFVILVRHLKLNMKKDSVSCTVRCTQPLSEMHMYVCEMSRHWCALCEGRTVLGFQIRTQKFLVICDSLMSVI